MARDAHVREYTRVRDAPEKKKRDINIPVEFDFEEAARRRRRRRL